MSDSEKGGEEGEGKITVLRLHLPFPDGEVDHKQLMSSWIENMEKEAKRMGMGCSEAVFMVTIMTLLESGAISFGELLVCSFLGLKALKNAMKKKRKREAEDAGGNKENECPNKKVKEGESV